MLNTQIQDRKPKPRALPPHALKHTHTKKETTKKPTKKTQQNTTKRGTIILIIKMELKVVSVKAKGVFLVYKFFIAFDQLEPRKAMNTEICM